MMSSSNILTHSAESLFKSGKLRDAVEAQAEQVRSRPGDQGQRLFLFELLAFSGDLDRARRQLDAVEYGDIELDAAVAGYRRLLDAERSRRRLFIDGERPQFLSTPPRHVELRLQAVDCLRREHTAEAADLLAQAAEASQPVHGELNGRRFELFCDADDLFGPTLELMSLTGAYFWVAIEQIETLEWNSPRFPRDLIWAPAHMQLRNGPQGDVFLPCLYPNSHECADEQVKLGRITEWREVDNVLVFGHGARTFLVDDEAVGALELRRLTIS